MSHEPRLPRLTPINQRYIAGRNEKRSQILLSAIRGRNVNEEFYMWIVFWLMSFQMSVMAFRYISVSCSGCLVVHESTCYLNANSLQPCWIKYCCLKFIRFIQLVNHRLQFVHKSGNEWRRPRLISTIREVDKRQKTPHFTLNPPHDCLFEILTSQLVHWCSFGCW